MSEFVNFLHEVFAQLGAINARKMFGGFGIYHNGVMFGLVSDDTLYLKTDKNTAQYFIEKDLHQFEYDKNGKRIKMSYYMAPEEILENPDDAELWARRAYEVALNEKLRKHR